jgi:cytochrome o ubiquinol oxidase operon protein cyoD
MSETHHKTQGKSEHGTLTSYVIGFVLSLLFTMVPYYLVVEKKLAAGTLTAAILGFAVIQLLVQITFFLHLGREPRPRWNLLFFVSTVGIILLIGIGSLWIMDHLDHNMSPSDMRHELIEGEGIHNHGY